MRSAFMRRFSSKVRRITCRRSLKPTCRSSRLETRLSASSRGFQKVSMTPLATASTWGAQAVADPGMVRAGLGLERVQERHGGPVDGDEGLLVEEERDLARELLGGVGVGRGLLVDRPQDHEGGGAQPLVLGPVLRVQAVLHREGMQAVLGGRAPRAPTGVGASTSIQRKRGFSVSRTTCCMGYSVFGGKQGLAGAGLEEVHVGHRLHDAGVVGAGVAAHADSRARRR